MGGEEIVPRLAHQGMDQGFEAAQALGVAEHDGAQRRAIDRAVGAERPGKGLADGGGRSAARAVERMHAGIGVVDRHAARPEHRRGGALAHADRAGEAEDERPAHRWLPRSATMRARKSGVTAGMRPNHREKPGTAWCSSMPSPSTAGRSRARAAARSGVSSGT